MRNVGAIYRRVSTADQAAEDRASLARQKTDCLRLAESQGYAVPDDLDFSEAISGAAETRPEFDRMLAAARAGRFTRLFIWAGDRLSRAGMVATLNVISELSKNGIDVHSVNDGSMDSELLVAVGAWAAKQEKDRIALRTQTGRSDARDRGRWMNGLAPYGFFSSGSGQLEQDPYEAAIVRRIFRQLCGGDGRVRICRELNQERVLPPLVKLQEVATGKVRHFRSNDKKIGGTREGLQRFMDEEKLAFANSGREPCWLESTVWKILTNDIYSGRVGGVTYDIKPAPILAMSTIEQARRTMALRHRKKELDAPRLLSGKVRCGCPDCGRAFSASRSGTKEKPYWYYQCSGRRSHAGCRNDAVRVDALDQHVLQMMSEYLQSRIGHDDFRSVLTRDAELEASSLRQHLDDAKARLAAARGEADAIKAQIRLMMSEGVGENMVRDEIRALRSLEPIISTAEAEEVRLLSEIGRLSEVSAANDSETTSAALRAFAELDFGLEPETGLAAEFALDPKLIIGLIVEKVTVKPDRQFEVTFKTDTTALSSVIQAAADFALRANRRLEEARMVLAPGFTVGPVELLA